MLNGFIPRVLERGVRVGSRRGPSLDSPAALLANFDSTTLQIRDWLSVEADMLRAQPVAVGDVDDIISQLDKQKVSTEHALHLHNY
ncbi:dystrophin isoforms A/C/F/G/H isoform 1 [Danaus plexippus plexippus]|uniref:Dystrophin isoforms A/C/F/G/H isoform 1 n=1 Tax=Danaus plexippus plexippus TaxID=278856 RepID=A0A212FBR2_DANPL|nr:dystrophin isoforms A/C/F/G/H isoform 1 [Danaus plexippus plexippus]